MNTLALLGLAACAGPEVQLRWASPHPAPVELSPAPFTAHLKPETCVVRPLQLWGEDELLGMVFVPEVGETDDLRLPSAQIRFSGALILSLELCLPTEAELKGEVLIRFAGAGLEHLEVWATDAADTGDLVDGVESGAQEAP